MRRFPIVGVLLLIPALALFTFVGCTKTKDEGKAQKEKDNDAKPVAKKSMIETPTDGTIKGVVMYKGTPPTPEVDPRILEHKEKAQCLEAPMSDKQKQTWIVGKNGGVANVVISLEPPAGKEFKITPELKAPFKKPVEMDQPFCAYDPHVIAVYAKIQPVIMKNGNHVTHNVKIQGGANNNDANKILAKGEKLEITSLNKSRDPINVACDMHGWMSAKILVFDQPYFAVTNKEGAFEIKNVPIDTELTVYMWHEANGKVVAQKLTAKKGENDLKLEIAPK